MRVCINILIDQKLRSFSMDYSELKELGLRKYPLKSSENIYEISITKDLVIVTTEPVILGNATSLKKVFPNNINAYDWDGNHLWNIADIVGDMGVPFWGGTVTTKEIMQGSVEFDGRKYDDACELFCCSTGNHLYVVDLGKRKLVQVLQTK